MRIRKICLCLSCIKIISTESQYNPIQLLIRVKTSNHSHKSPLIIQFPNYTTVHLHSTTSLPVVDSLPEGSLYFSTGLSKDYIECSETSIKERKSAVPGPELGALSRALAFTPHLPARNATGKSVASEHLCE